MSGFIVHTMATLRTLVELFTKAISTASPARSGSGDKSSCAYCNRPAISLRSVWSAGDRALVALCLWHSQRGTPTFYGVRDVNDLAGYWRED